MLKRQKPANFSCHFFTPSCSEIVANFSCVFSKAATSSSSRRLAPAIQELWRVEEVVDVWEKAMQATDVVADVVVRQTLKFWWWRSSWQLVFDQFQQLAVGQARVEAHLASLAVYCRRQLQQQPIFFLVSRLLRPVTGIRLPTQPSQ